MFVGVVAAFACGWMFLVPVWWQDPSLMRQVELLLSEQWNISLPVSLPTNQFPQWIFRHPQLHGLAVSVAGAVVGGGVIWGVRIIAGWAMREEAMGFGDVILMAMIGSFLGWQPTLVAFFVALLCAVLIGLPLYVFRLQRALPFGPYLSLGAVVVLFGWEAIWRQWSPVFDYGILLPPLALMVGLSLGGALLVVRRVKQMLGFSTGQAGWIEEWTPADQLMQFAGNKLDDEHRFRQLNSQPVWPGTSAARGTHYDQRWRNGACRR
jgi:leader peptidase (prepilin peptidase)/N-methyltransferase